MKNFGSCQTANDVLIVLLTAIIHLIFQAWTKVFYSIPLKRGERIITCEQEYAANYVAMLQVDD